MDFLNDIFDTLDLKGVLYFRTDFSPPWGTTVPLLENAARFHFVVQGNCYVSVNSSSPLKLSAGDLIIIPRGVSHTLAHAPESETPPLEQVLSSVGYKGEGVLTIGSKNTLAATQMICGHFSFRDKAEHPVLGALPEYIVLSNQDRAQFPLLDEMLHVISRRIFVDELGSEASITRLSEIVFIELLKTYLSKSGHLSSILSAFKDPKIGKSLQLIHKEPNKNWSVESLAQQVAMSRSRFAFRFNELVGVSPMAYLSDWRLQKALLLLDQSQMNVQQIATHTGYQSPSAFTRAFTMKFGLSPREYRK